MKRVRSRKASPFVGTHWVLNNMKLFGSWAKSVLKRMSGPFVALVLTNDREEATAWGYVDFEFESRQVCIVA